MVESQKTKSKKKTSIKIDSGIWRKVKTAAAHSGVTMSEFVEASILMQLVFENIIVGQKK